jgi:hypothetical protein
MDIGQVAEADGVVLPAFMIPALTLLLLRRFRFVQALLFTMVRPHMPLMNFQEFRMSVLHEAVSQVEHGPLQLQDEVHFLQEHRGAVETTGVMKHVLIWRREERAEVLGREALVLRDRALRGKIAVVESRLAVDPGADEVLVEAVRQGRI